MVSLWTPYLAKGPKPDFNNGPGDGFNRAVLWHFGVYYSQTRIMRLFVPDLNSGPSLGHSNTELQI